MITGCPSLFRAILMMAVSMVYGSVFAQSDMQYLNSSEKQVWKVRPQSGDNADSWVTAVVPGTVFASYVAAGLEKDPNFGDNIYKVDRTKYDRSFWYRTEFVVPAGYSKKKIWLNFKGVNRKAEIYLNEVLIGSLDGFMQRGKFDVTALVHRSGKNVLTVLVSIPRQSLANLGSPTYLSAAGWDWMPYVPGLNSGITDNVYLSNTDDLTIADPWIRASLPTNARAELSVQVEVRNQADHSRTGILKGVITPGNIEFSQKVSVDGNGVRTILLDKKIFSQLVINNPKLWWPNGYGEPNLYTCKLSLLMGDEVSDVQTVPFGIKRYSYDTVGQVLHVSINGVKVFIKGGDWGMSEYMLRCRGEEYDAKVRLHKEMNFNMIRNWIGTTTDEEFYDACDKYGIMVWDEFWLNAGSGLPADINVYNANAVEKIKRFRNHPAIAIWCAENEGDPDPPIGNWLREDLLTFDGGERYYQPNSHAGNLTGSGPWGSHDPRYYFMSPPPGSGGNIGWGMRSELGTAVFVNFESFKKFMPKEGWWPRNEMWNRHFFGEQAFNAAPDRYDEEISSGYGAPKGIEDYCRKAQFLNIETNKAMYEGWLDHIWEDASGLMTWMSQSAYPSMVWQTYDYYYDLTGAYFGAKKACEPIHIQWNPASNSVKVINTTRKDAEGLTAEAAIYNLDGRPVANYSARQLVDAPSNSAVECFRLKLGDTKANLALNKPVYASSSSEGEPDRVNDGNDHSRWSSRYGDNEWIYIDLGKEDIVNGVALHWEDAYAKSFKIQVSDDAKTWRDVYTTASGTGGEQQIPFMETRARYVKMQGVERATSWGYSLWNFEVYQGDVPSEGLSDVHFIKLKLTDKTGRLVSDNFYWRGNKRTDYTALNTLPRVNLKVSSQVTRADGKVFIKALITNPETSPAAAFGIWVRVLRSASGEQILPVIMNDNYFSLMRGETKEIVMEFKESDLGNDIPKLKVDPYNNQTGREDTIYKNKNAAIPARVEDLLSRMTLKEKVLQLQNKGAGKAADIDNIFKGNSYGCTHEMSMNAADCADMYQKLQQYMLTKTRLGIPILTAVEGIEGILQNGCTIFPQELAQGSTFNPALIRRMTEAAGAEANVIGIHQVLSPVLDIARELRWGRVEETYGEDPYLIGEMATAFVRGYQKYSITCTPKHFLAHGSPSGGLNCANVSGGERELRSLYMYPFKKVIEATRPLSVMSCYSSYDGVAVSGSHYYMTDILRGEMGFTGYVYSDWGSVDRLKTFHHAVETSEDAARMSLIAGVDLDIDGDYETLEKMVGAGKLDIAVIDQAVRRILTVKFTLGLFDNPYGDAAKVDKVVHSTANVALAKEVADESAILVKNNNSILPLDLSKYKSIAVVGPNSDQTVFGDYSWTQRDTKEGVTLLQGLKEVLGDKVILRNAEGCDWWSGDKAGIANAVKAVESSDLAIVAIGTRSTFLGRSPLYSTAGEGFDLSSLELPGVQEDLLKAIKATGKPMIVVFIAGKPLAMPWVKDNADAVLIQWYGGEKQGRALADILTGAVNPSGRLNVSFPRSTGNTPCYYNHYITDRDEPFDRPGTKQEPKGHYIFESPQALWSFGYGLSYTHFNYFDCRVKDSVLNTTDTIRVELTVENAGARDGEEVVQLYVRDLFSSVATPVQQLKAFTKELIRSGEQKKVLLSVPVSELGLYNDKMQYVVEPGEFEVQVGSASDLIHFRKMIRVR